MRTFQTVKQLLFWSILCLLAVGVAEGSGLAKNTIQGTVLKVFPSPGMWAGTIESVQWFDLKVVKSRVPSIKPDDVLHIGVPLVMGNALFDQQKREFSKSKVAPGKLLALRVSANCSKSQDTSRYVVEPKCIQILK
jgi:hypothetical protein